MVSLLIHFKKLYFSEGKFFLNNFCSFFLILKLYRVNLQQQTQSRYFFVLNIDAQKSAINFSSNQQFSQVNLRIYDIRFEAKFQG